LPGRNADAYGDWYGNSDRNAHLQPGMAK